MMLDYLNNEKLKILESDLDENKIAKIMNTTVSGTVFSDVENINKAMTKSDPSVEFCAEFQHHTLDDIRKELKKNYQCLFGFLQAMLISYTLLSLLV